MENNKYYVYRHRCPITFNIRYIGKGQKRRAWTFSGRRAYHKNWINFLQEQNLRPIVEIVSYNMTEEKVLELESFLIQEYVDLCNNLTNILKNGDKSRKDVGIQVAWNKGFFGERATHFGKKHLPETKELQSNSAYKRAKREGVKGVFYDNRCPNKPWCARITISKGVRKYIGYYSTEQEAVEAYLKELEKYVL